MIVTSFYDIYGKPENFINYIYLFYDIGISGIPIILFTDPSLVNKFRIFPSSVKVIGLPLNEFELYRLAMNYKGALPANRSEKKDTKEFLAIMNTKVEFLLRASALCEDKTFVWIDFGILKISKNYDKFISKLKEINELEYDKIQIPGCWSYGRAGFSVDSVNWRFCGGVVVVPRKHIQCFYNHSKNVLTDFCKMSQYKLTWETNVWAIVEMCAEDKIISWYLADHNDSIIQNIPIPA